MKYSREWFREYRANRRATQANRLPHGTQQGYANWGCRCDSCRNGHRKHVAEWRATR